jgi:hypothetical protein
MYYEDEQRYVKLNTQLVDILRYIQNEMSAAMDEYRAMQKEQEQMVMSGQTDVARLKTLEAQKEAELKKQADRLRELNGDDKAVRDRLFMLKNLYDAENNIMNVPNPNDKKLVGISREFNRVADDAQNLVVELSRKFSLGIQW